jgi:hypothetical protein
LILFAYFSVCFEVPFGYPLLRVGEKERKENFKQFFITAKEEVGGGNQMQVAVKNGNKKMYCYQTERWYTNFNVIGL